jgi:hypothetical protein
VFDYFFLNKDILLTTISTLSVSSSLIIRASTLMFEIVAEVGVPLNGIFSAPI